MSALIVSQSDLLSALFAMSAVPALPVDKFANWWKLLNLVEIVNLVEVVKFGRYCEIWLKL